MEQYSVTYWPTKETYFYFRQSKTFSLLSEESGYDVGPTQPPIQHTGLQGLFSQEQGMRSVKLATHFRPVTRLRIKESIPCLPHTLHGMWGEHFRFILPQNVRFKFMRLLFVCCDALSFGTVTSKFFVYLLPPSSVQNSEMGASHPRRF
jgi:hypothetical protein